VGRTCRHHGRGGACLCPEHLREGGASLKPRSERAASRRAACVQRSPLRPAAVFAGGCGRPARVRMLTAAWCWLTARAARHGWLARWQRWLCASLRWCDATGQCEPRLHGSWLRSPRPGQSLYRWRTRPERHWLRCGHWAKQTTHTNIVLRSRKPQPPPKTNNDKNSNRSNLMAK
jgi:hypothetical protein